MPSSSVIRGNADVVAAIAIAALGLVLVALGQSQSPLAAIVGVLVVLLAPGYAVQAALFPTEDAGLGTRSVLTLGTSLCLAVVGGFVLNAISAGLTSASWAILLGVITAAGGGVAIVRRGRQPVRRPWPSLKLPSVRAAALWGSAVAIVALAFAIDGRSAESQPRAGFTQLWLLPATGGPASMVRIGVQNQEQAGVTYDLQLREGGTVVKRWPTIALRDGESWSATISLPAEAATSGPVEADLYRAGSTAVPYRHAILWPNIRSGA